MSFTNLPSLQVVELPSTLTRIDDYSFTDLTAMQELTLAGSSLSIGEGCFTQLNNLDRLTLAIDDFIGVGSYSFCNLDALKELELPTALRKINTGTFRNMASLENLSLPESAEKPALTDVWINENAFGGCPAVLAVRCPNDTPPNMTDEYGRTHVFAGAGDDTAPIDKQRCRLLVPKGAKEVYEAHPSWKGFATIEEYDAAGADTILSDVNITAGEGVKVMDGRIFVDNAEGTRVSIHGVDGRKHFDSHAKTAEIQLPRGVYVVLMDDNPVKIRL